MENLILSMTELVQTHNSKPVTTSLKIAEVFGKRHDNVIRDIESLDIPTERLLLNFEEIYFDDKYGRKQKCYKITRTGFTLLAMGYTGAKAMQFKLAYIDAFDAMEQALMSQRLSKEKKYFERKAELYKQKHHHETQIKTILNRFYNSQDGIDLKNEKENMSKVKNEIAQMDREEFGYTHNLFSMLDEPKNEPLILTSFSEN